jgi:hypothetical protein
MVFSTGNAAQAPVAGRQAFLLQAVSSTLGQLTVLAGLVSHWPLARLQKGLPLQASPSSWQSALALHLQTSAPPPHSPPWQTSPLLQASPSSHGLP